MSLLALFVCGRLAWSVGDFCLPMELLLLMEPNDGTNADGTNEGTLRVTYYVFCPTYKKSFRNFAKRSDRKFFLIHKIFLNDKNHISNFCRLPDSLLHAGDIISSRPDADLIA